MRYASSCRPNLVRRPTSVILHWRGIVTNAKKNHYEVLGLQRDASRAQIRDAYIALSKKHHPDRNQDSHSAHQKFVAINEAFQTLGNATSRRDYDSRLNAGHAYTDWRPPPPNPRAGQYYGRPASSGPFYHSYSYQNPYEQEFERRHKAREAEQVQNWNDLNKAIKNFAFLLVGTYFLLLGVTFYDRHWRQGRDNTRLDVAVRKAFADHESGLYGGVRPVKPSDKTKRKSDQSTHGGPAVKKPRTYESKSAEKKPWWKTAVIYQIYPRSFFDSNGDGIGDIKGITAKLPYLKSLDIGALWLSPIYLSPMADFGYDVQDFRAIDPIFGTLEDYTELVREAHGMGLKIILDFVPNHTSDQHDWFVRSGSQSRSKYSDYYVWNPGKIDPGTGKRTPPNNWLSLFGGPAWTWHNGRGEFYFHQFLKEQPDLNYRNSEVRAEMLAVLRHWLDLGTDGFRIDAVPSLLEDEQLRDEPTDPEFDGEKQPEHKRLKRIYTQDQPETIEVVRGWMKFAQDYQQSHADRDALLFMAEAYSPAPVLRQYYAAGVHFPFNFGFLGISSANLTRAKVTSVIRNWIEVVCIGRDSHPNWVMSNHDHSRAVSRFGGPHMGTLINMLLLLLPGTAIVYQGEELGLPDGHVPPESNRDPVVRWGRKSRDPARTPIPWTTEAVNLGFCQNDVKPWLPLDQAHRKMSVESQLKRKDSCLSNYKKLMELRKMEAFTNGTLEVTDLLSENIFAFKRITEKTEALVVLCLSGKATVKLSLAQVKIGSKLLFSTFEIKGTQKFEKLDMEDGDGAVFVG